MDEIIQGTLTDAWLRQNGTQEDIDAEEATIYPGTLVYYYFNDTEHVGIRSLGDHILVTGQVASKARRLSLAGMTATLDANEPHYGDGTYVTCHSALFRASLEVKRHHGMTISSRRARAVLQVLAPIRLRRILHTGGIGIAPPDGPITGLILLGEPEVKVLRIERLEADGKWTP